MWESDMLAISQVLQQFEARHVLFNDFGELEAAFILIGRRISTDGVSLMRGPSNDRRYNALFVDEDYDWPILLGLVNLNESLFMLCNKCSRPTNHIRHTQIMSPVFQPGSTASCASKAMRLLRR
jgi:hypothetical protein